MSLLRDDSFDSRLALVRNSATATLPKAPDTSNSYLEGLRSGNGAHFGQIVITHLP